MTQGPWMVDGRVSFGGSGPGFVLDERSGFLYFTATEKDPRERHLYRVRLDGTGRTRLTREDGTHRTVVAPDGRFYADTWSDARTPPKLWVSSQDGTKRHAVEENANPPILGFERGTLEFAEVKAKDGTTLYGSLLKPADFDPAKRYPVILSVYGGPHAQTVTNAWEHTSPFEHLLASRGFLVWSLDNRGMAARGTAFESAIHRDLGRVELEDQLAGVEHLKSLPFVDPARIGITGWSYGGYMTLYAVTNAPDDVPGRRGRRSGHRLEALRLDLHRALHGDAGGRTRRGTRRAPRSRRPGSSRPTCCSSTARPTTTSTSRTRCRSSRRSIKAGKPYSLAGAPAPAPRLPARRRTASRATARCSPTSSGRCCERRPRRSGAARPRRAGRLLRRSAGDDAQAPPESGLEPLASPRTPHEASAGTATATSPPRARHCSARREARGAPLRDLVGERQQDRRPLDGLAVLPRHERRQGPRPRVLVPRLAHDRGEERHLPVREAAEVGGQHEVGHVLVPVEEVHRPPDVEDARAPGGAPPPPRPAAPGSSAACERRGHGLPPPRPLGRTSPRSATARASSELRRTAAVGSSVSLRQAASQALADALPRHDDVVGAEQLHEGVDHEPAAHHRVPPVGVEAGHAARFLSRSPARPATISWSRRRVST